MRLVGEECASDEKSIDGNHRALAILRFFCGGNFDTWLADRNVFTVWGQLTGRLSASRALDGFQTELGLISTLTKYLSLAEETWIATRFGYLRIEDFGASKWPNLSYLARNYDCYYVMSWTCQELRLCREFLRIGSSVSFVYDTPRDAILLYVLGNRRTVSRMEGLCGKNWTASQADRHLFIAWDQFVMRAAAAFIPALGGGHAEAELTSVWTEHLSLAAFNDS
jgi:hypothetical protein